MKDRLDEVDLLKAQMLEARMETAAVRAEAARDALQAHVDTLWDRYGLRKGIDAIHPDGRIERGPVQDAGAKAEG